jgi:two-component system CheB/CheR fusion protein
VSYNMEKKPAYFTGVINDITIHKQDELRKNDFIAMVSHDLKSPLTAIQAYMQLITFKVKKEEDTFINSSLARVNASIKKMNRMINGFLTVSGSEEGQIYLELETFSMNGLLEEIVEESRFINPEVEILFTPGVALNVKADRDKIGQVLNNYINNAIKYSNKLKVVEVSMTALNGTAHVCVKDKGIGIKVHDMDKIFERYYRVKRMDTKSTPGFGLGLYMSSEIIKRHGGNVRVESEMNKGSSFFFSLPILAT